MKILPLGKAKIKKRFFLFVLLSLNRTLTSSKILPLNNEKK